MSRPPFYCKSLQRECNQYPRHGSGIQSSREACLVFRFCSSAVISNELLTRYAVVIQAIAGGVTDFLLMITPIPTVLGLQMSRKAKAAVIAWFGVGIITLIMSNMRLVSLLSQLSSGDTPWTMPEAML